MCGRHANSDQRRTKLQVDPSSKNDRSDMAASWHMAGIRKSLCMLLSMLGEGGYRRARQGLWIPSRQVCSCCDWWTITPVSVFCFAVVSLSSPILLSLLRLSLSLSSLRSSLSSSSLTLSLSSYLTPSSIVSCCYHH